MPKILINFFQKESEDLTDFLRQHPQIESLLVVGNSFLVNFSGSKDESLELWSKIQSVFQHIEVRELCCGKCRDGSDCLNYVKKEGYCWKHQVEK